MYIKSCKVALNIVQLVFARIVPNIILAGGWILGIGLIYGFWQFVLMHPEAKVWQSDRITWFVFGMAGSIGWIFGLLVSRIISRDLALPIIREQVYLVQRIDNCASVCAHCKSYTVGVSEQTVERVIEEEHYPPNDHRHRIREFAEVIRE